MTPVAVLATLLGMFAGGVAGGAVGFGVVLVGAPVVALVAPHLLPVVFVAPSIAANGYVAVSERRSRDPRLLGRLVAWQVPGVAIGLVFLTRIDDTDELALAASLVVLSLVLVGLSPWRPQRTRTTEAVAASVAGLAGSLSGVNGPPLAVLMAHDDPGLLRATLPAYFVIAQVVLMVGWAVVGRLSASALGVGALAVPAAVAGAAVGQRVLAHRLTPTTVRVVVMVLALAAAVRAVVSRF